MTVIGAISVATTNPETLISDQTIDTIMKFMSPNEKAPVRSTDDWAEQIIDTIATKILAIYRKILIIYLKFTSFTAYLGHDSIETRQSFRTMVELQALSEATCTQLAV